MNLYWHIIIIQRPWFTLLIIHDIVLSTGLGKCIITCVHHYNMYRILISLLYTSSVLYPYPWKSLIFFIVTIVLSFLECYIVKNILYIIFSNWIILLGNIHLSFFHDFSWIDSSFLYSKIIFIVLISHSLFIHVLTEGYHGSSKFWKSLIKML